MTFATNEFRSNLLFNLKQRNFKENEPFFHLIKSHNKLFESNSNLKSELNESKFTNQKLQQENLDLLKLSNISTTNTITHEKIQQLEERLLKSKDEVIDLQKKLVEQAQQVIALNKQLKEKNDELSLKEAKIIEAENRYENLKTQNRDLENRLASLEEAGKLWHDEKVESEMQYNVLLQKHEKLKEDYQAILTATLKFREEQIDRINKLNELEIERSKQKLKEELESASQSTDIQPNPMKNFLSGLLKTSTLTASNIDDLRPQVNCTVQVVSRACCKFECHEGEVNAIRFYRTGKYFATGGGDRKIKLWEYKDNKCDYLGSLIGSNASIASIDINSESNLIAGTSFDFACRLWSLNDNRLRMSSGDIQPTITLTGHTNKVLAGKFLGVSKIVTGSYDRTLKVWDLQQKACIKTLFAGSSCNDAVAYDSQAVISGHLDKKIRFWDIRTDPTQSEILLQGKITSLDISANKNYLLACIRDVNALKLIDIRMNQVTETFCCDEFKLSYDWSKAVFSPDLDQQYVCAGSSDGNLIIWNTNTTKVEKILKEHNSAILSLAWHPQGQYLVTCDNKRKAVVWV